MDWQQQAATARDRAHAICRECVSQVHVTFTREPRKRGQTYFQHLAAQGTRGFCITGYGLMTLTNAVFPFWFDGVDRSLQVWLDSLGRAAETTESA